MTKKTMIRVPKELTKEIRNMQGYPRESYASIIKRMIEKERRLSK